MRPVALLSVLLILTWVPIVTSAQPGSQGQTADIQGMEMFYRSTGSGEALVLLHGFSGSGELWEPLLPHFGAHFRVIVPDLRGHGRSSNPSGEFTHRQAARDVFSLLDRLGVRRCRGIGISTGGMTLIHMATQQPERVQSMILVGATHYFPEQAREIMRGVRDDNLSPQEWERLRERHQRGDEQIRALRRQFHGFKDSYDDMNFTPPFLATIQAETLIMHGDRDRFFPVEIPLEQYRSIPNSYLWIVPNGGHVPPITGEMRPEFERTALQFLKGEWKNQVP